MWPGATSWLAEGPAGFYSEGYFADYPPGYLWVLGLVGRRSDAALLIAYEAGMDLRAAGAWCPVAVRLRGGGAGVDHIAGKRGRVGAHMALVLAAFAAFDPLLLFDTSGVEADRRGVRPAAAALLLCCWNSAAACPRRCWFGVALAIKPQALLFGPVLAVPASWRPSRWKKIPLPRALAAASAVRRWRCCPPLAAGPAVTFGLTHSCCRSW